MIQGNCDNYWQENKSSIKLIDYLINRISSLIKWNLIENKTNNNIIKQQQNNKMGQMKLLPKQLTKEC